MLDIMQGFLSVLLMVVAVSTEKQYIPRNVQPFSQQMVNHINAMNSTWTAGHNFGEGTTLEHLRGMTGVAPDYAKKRSPTKRQQIRHDLPEHFDARQRWPECPNIGRVEDQGNCGICWAFSAAAAMSDRICIKTNGMQNIRLSAMDILGCCQNCSYNCTAGYPNMAWNFYVNEGVVTGGPYHSNEGCKPYQYYSCEHHNATGHLRPCVKRTTEPACRKQCQNLYNRKYQDDKHYGSESYLVNTDEKAMRTEIFNNGPVQTTIKLYADIVHYKTGVYQQLSKVQVSAHAIRLIGWGKENGVPYWLAVNSFNTNFGEDGYLKIIRGKNECEMESYVTAGLPKLNRKTTNRRQQRRN